LLLLSSVADLCAWLMRSLSALIGVNSIHAHSAHSHRAVYYSEKGPRRSCG